MMCSASRCCGAICNLQEVRCWKKKEEETLFVNGIVTVGAVYHNDKK